jgi:glycosyltransferase involved in cell wall biosynthesis
VEHASNGVIAGWARAAEGATVRLVADGVTIATDTTHVARDDVDARAFAFDLIFEPYDVQPRTLELIAGRHHARLESPSSGDRSVTLGSIESRGTITTGWIARPDLPDRPATALLMCDTGESHVVRGAIPREDVLRRYGAPRSGFVTRAAASTSAHLRLASWANWARVAHPLPVPSSVPPPAPTEAFDHRREERWSRAAVAILTGVAPTVLDGKVIAAALAAADSASDEVWVAHPLSLIRGASEDPVLGGPGGHMPPERDAELAARALLARRSWPPNRFLTAAEGAWLRELTSAPGIAEPLPRFVAARLSDQRELARLGLAHLPADLAARALYAEEQAVGCLFPRPDEKPSDRRPAQLRPCDLTVIANLRHRSAVGDLARDSVALASATGAAVSGLTLEDDVPLSWQRPASPGVGIGLLHLQPPELGTLCLAWAPHLLSYDRLAGYVAWELDRVPQSYLHPTWFMDELWVPSKFIASAFRASGATSELKLIRPSVKQTFDVISRDAYGFDPDDFVVHFAFDANSGVRRKNPVAVLKVFRAAFDDDHAKLLLKVRHFSVIEDLAHRGDVGAAQLLKLVRGDARIVLEVQDLSANATLGLTEMSDCHLSLHRAEGFGLGMAEAMALGIPTVGTGWSGNLDFMTPSTAWLVRPRLQTVQHGDYLDGTDGCTWADPDMNEAVEALRHVRAGGFDVRHRREAGRDFIRRNYGRSAALADLAAALAPPEDR